MTTKPQKEYDYKRTQNGFSHILTEFKNQPYPGRGRGEGGEYHKQNVK